jgi:hypothetical protein
LEAIPSGKDNVPSAKPEESIPRRENGRPKSTTNIFKNFSKEGNKTGEETTPVSTVPDKPLELNTLKSAWQEFAEQRKNQIAEYQLLQRDFTLKDSLITVPLSNPIEEPLLLNIRSPLIAYLRNKLTNNSIMVTGVLEKAGSKKVVYTSKEKFDHLAEKNPLLKELKERLGLDTDF